MKMSLTKAQSETLCSVLRYALENLPADKIVWNKRKKKNELVMRDGYDEFKANAGNILCHLNGITITPAKGKVLRFDKILNLTPKQLEKTLASLGIRDNEVTETAQALQTK